jgi:hypothetical protein
MASPENRRQRLGFGGFFYFQVTSAPRFYGAVE